MYVLWYQCHALFWRIILLQTLVESDHLTGDHSNGHSMCIGKIISLNFNYLVLSYITNILIVCQGEMIFILFVLLSKQVCVITIVSSNTDFYVGK